MSYVVELGELLNADIGRLDALLFELRELRIGREVDGDLYDDATREEASQYTPEAWTNARQGATECDYEEHQWI